jgi:streptogramin lyase
MKVPILLLISCYTFWTFHVSAHPGSGIFLDQQGQIYFTDTGEGVWKIDSKRACNLFSKSALHWMAYDEEGRFAHAPERFGYFERITPTGSKPVLLLCSDFPCTVGKDGNLYYADTRQPTRIIRRTPDGKESVLAGGSGQSLVLRGVTGIATGPDASLYIAESDQDSGHHAVLKIAMNGKVFTFSSNFLSSVQSEPAAHGSYCRGLVVHPNGNVFVAATDRRCVVRITPQGKASLALQSTSLWSPTGVTIFRDELYVLEYSDMPPGWNPDDRKGWVPRVRKVDRNGNVVIVGTVPRQEAILRAK